MCIIQFYKEKLEAVRQEKVKVKAQLAVLNKNLETHSPNHKNWADWYNEKTEYTNKLCNLIGSEKHYEQKIESF